jgi:hypothetical protein
MNLNLSTGDKVAIWDDLNSTFESSWTTVQHPDGSYELATVTPVAGEASSFWKSPVSRQHLCQPRDRQHLLAPRPARGESHRRPRTRGEQVPLLIAGVTADRHQRAPGRAAVGRALHGGAVGPRGVARARPAPRREPDLPRMKTLTDCRPSAHARLTFTMRSRADVALQSFLSGSGEAEPC